MRYFFLLFIIGLLVACQTFSPADSNQPAAITTSPESVELPLTKEMGSTKPRNWKYWQSSIKREFEQGSLYSLKDTLLADFDGDGILDSAWFLSEVSPSGIFLELSSVPSSIRLGFGAPFAHVTDFDWVDYWGIVQDSNTYEIQVIDGEIQGDSFVPLPHSSIFLRQEEVGGGVISWQSGSFLWIHQAG